MNCAQCGATLVPGAQFCGACGARAVSSSGAQPAAATTTSSTTTTTAASGRGAPGQGIHIDSDARGQGRGYTYEVLHQPSFSLAVIKLQAEQAISAEAGAMVSMSANVELQSQMKGGVFGALKRAVGGESAFVSTFTARGGPGESTLR